MLENFINEEDKYCSIMNKRIESLKAERDRLAKEVAIGLWEISPERFSPKVRWTRKKRNK
jgi:hypothetical protein